MAPPSSLPSWWDFNLAVLQALVRRLVRDTSGAWVEHRFAEVISRREQLRSFTPDFMAQLMEEEVGLDYFRVLQALDASAWNANHGALAGLAAAGVLRAVVTTNFDCLLERALDARQTPYRVYATAESFDALPGVVRSPAPEGLPLIKAHGSVTDPSSMVDTLAQRVAGRPKALEESIAALLEQYPCLMLGFSGADLAYDPDYLGLRPAAARGAGLCALVLPGTKPRPPMRKLLDAWGPRGSEVEGELPQWFAALATGLGAHAAAAPPDVAASSWQERLAERTEAWVDSLGTVSAVNMFTALADANSDADNVLRYLMFYRRYYRSTEDALRPQYWRFEYNLGRRLLDRGLIGTIDPVAAGVVPEWQHDVEATAYVDAFQFLSRAAERRSRTPAGRPGGSGEAARAQTGARARHRQPGATRRGAPERAARPRQLRGGAARRGVRGGTRQRGQRRPVLPACGGRRARTGRRAAAGCGARAGGTAPRACQELRDRTRSGRAGAADRHGSLAARHQG